MIAWPISGLRWCRLAPCAQHSSTLLRQTVAPCQGQGLLQRLGHPVHARQAMIDQPGPSGVWVRFRWPHRRQQWSLYYPTVMAWMRGAAACPLGLCALQVVMVRMSWLTGLSGRTIVMLRMYQIGGQLQLTDREGKLTPAARAGYTR